MIKYIKELYSSYSYYGVEEVRNRRWKNKPKEKGIQFL